MPGSPFSGDTYSEAPTKPTKPPFVGFVDGSTHTFPEIKTAPIPGDTYPEEPSKPTKPKLISNHSAGFPEFDSLAIRRC
jgi:hypothetical protein